MWTTDAGPPTASRAVFYPCTAPGRRPPSATPTPNAPVSLSGSRGPGQVGYEEEQLTSTQHIKLTTQKLTLNQHITLTTLKLTLTQHITLTALKLTPTQHVALTALKLTSAEIIALTTLKLTLTQHIFLTALRLLFPGCSVQLVK